jgi:hypothetical protein
LHQDKLLGDPTIFDVAKRTALHPYRSILEIEIRNMQTKQFARTDYWPEGRSGGLINRFCEFLSGRGLTAICYSYNIF